MDIDTYLFKDTNMSVYELISIISHLFSRDLITGRHIDTKLQIIFPAPQITHAIRLLL